MSDKHEMWVTGYEPSGFKISFTFKVDSINEGLLYLGQLKEVGITPSAPNLETGEKVDTVATVVRREHLNEKDGSITPVVDFYPAWEGEFGRYRFCGIYLNTPEDIAEFERQAGVKLESLPLYASQAPLQRSAARAHQCEVKVKPFDVIKVATGEKVIDGELRTVYKFSRYATPRPMPPSVRPPAIVRAAVQPEPTPPGKVSDFRQRVDDIRGEHIDPPALNGDEQNPAVNPFNGQPVTEQPPLAGVEGIRTDEEITKMCTEFYTWAAKTHKQLSHDDLHEILDVKSAKDYFATRSQGDARTVVANFVKNAAELAKGA